MKTSCPFLIGILLALAACEPTAPKEAQPVSTPYPVAGKIERLDPAFDAIVPQGANIEVLATGFTWSEGPVWIEKGGYLLFTDIPPNRIMRWKEGEGAALYLSPSGYTGSTPRGGEPGANGLLLGSGGQLLLCQHGDRRVARMNAPLDQPKADFVSVAERWNNKRFNSPNDAVFARNGNLYLTDPPYGLEKQLEDPGKEIPFQGVYLCRPDGRVELLVDSLSRPNGIALSPDEKTLYVANSDPGKAIWMAYEVQADGTLKNGRLFYDATAKVSDAMPGLPDGLKVNPEGILFATGSGGVWIFSAAGQPLGRIDTGQPTANCAFGNGGNVLYMTANHSLMRVRLKP